VTVKWQLNASTELAHMKSSEISLFVAPIAGIRNLRNSQSRFMFACVPTAESILLLSLPPWNESRSSSSRLSAFLLHGQIRTEWHSCATREASQHLKYVTRSFQGIYDNLIKAIKRTWQGNATNELH
jgi:hypothetical protein